MATDQTFVFNPTGATIEMHVGNAPGSSGQNAKAPIDAPIIPPNVVTGTILNKTVGTNKIVNPA